MVGQRPVLYTLDGHTPVPLPDDTAGVPRDIARGVGRTTLGDGRYQISTVFLYFDHQFADGPPLLWETMVFNHDNPDDPWHEAQWRYATWDEAEAGHARVVAAIQAGNGPDAVEEGP